jgi:hypothetical protein
VRLLAHLLDYLLHHMVSIEVKRTILDLFWVKELLNHQFFLMNIKNLNSRLDHPAPVLICWILKHVSANVMKNDVQVFFSNPGHHLYFLNYIIAKAIEY